MTPAMTATRHPLPRPFHRMAAALLLAFTALDAFAGAGVSAAMQKGQTILSDVSSGLTALGIIVVTIAIMFVGFRMLFGGAHWRDLAPIFWGGLLIGGAAAGAGALLG